MFPITKALAPVILFAGLGHTAELQVDVSGVSATQAILRYRSPNNRPCSVEVSESNTFLPLVHDLDPALFEGVGDARSGKLNRGPARVFVVGQRKAQKARNGFWYSRALQANAVHYFRVTCGLAIGTGSFRTTTIPLGNTYNEMHPPDPDVSQYTPAGAYAWPEFVSWTDRAESVVDPQTGLLLKRVSMPEDFPIDWLGDEAVGSAVDLDGKWSNPEAVKTDDSGAAVFAGGGTNWLLLRADSMNLGEGGSATLTYLGRTVNSIQVALKAWCSGTCAEEDRKVELCLTVNGVSCAGAIRELALGTSAMLGGSQPLLVGTTKPILDYWTAEGGRPLNRSDLVVRAGTAAVNGRTVTWQSGHYFNMAWTAGSRITLNGQEYEIASVDGLKSLTLKSDAGTATGTSYRATNAGVLLRKKTGSGDSISVQYARLKVGISHLPEGWPSSGSPEVCQTAVTKDAAGNEGYRCVIPDGAPVVYWINRASGESKALGVFSTDNRSGVDGWGGTFCNGWFGSADPDALFCMVQDNSAAQNQVILKCKLTGANETGGWKPVCENLTPASKGSGFAAQLAAFTGGKFDPTKFGCGVPGIQNERILVVCNRAGQDSFGWLVVVDPAKARPVCDSGANNCVIAAQNTWSVAPARWCTMHTPFYMGATDWYWVAGRFLDDQGGPGQGPYVSQITSGALGATDLDACPANAADQSVAGARLCSTVTVDGEPRDPSPHGGETGAPGELQNAEPGDVLYVDGELTQLLAKNGNAWSLRRGYGRTPAREHAASQTLSEQCLAQPFERGTPSYSWSWDYLHDPTGANPQGMTVRKEFDFDHPAGRGGLVVGGASYLDCGSGGCYQARTSGIWGAKPDVIVNGNGGFAGVAGGANGNAAENHASFAQVAAPDSEKRWMLDGRPFQPGPETSGPFTPVSGQLYKLSTTTKDGDELGGAARLSRLKMPTFAFCGTQVLRDASSAATGDLLGAGAADSYKYCVSRRKGECRSDAQPGDIWVNCPVVTTPSCANWWDQGNVSAGICVTVPHMYLSSVGQIGFAANDPKGSLGRKLTMGLSRNMLVDVYWNQRALPDASWMLFRSVWLNGVRTEALLAKMVPYPEPDGIDRSDFVPMTVTATGEAVAGTDNVTVQFGYAENGGADKYFCTSRHEACVKGSASGYGMAGDEIAGVPCSGACSITVPAISGRAMYYRVVYRDAENRLLGASAPAVTLVP